MPCCERMCWKPLFSSHPRRHNRNVYKRRTALSNHSKIFECKCQLKVALCLFLLLLNALLALPHGCCTGRCGAFSPRCSLYFYIRFLPCFGGIPLGRNPHLLCLRALRFLICSGLFVFGKMCCACRAHGALGDGAKPLACRDPEDMHEPTGWSKRGSWSLVQEAKENLS